MLLDDIASVLDDVAVLTKKAAAKTAGVLGDDLALNAQQVSGVMAQRELPVIWRVAKGSLVNKLILVPSALALNAFAPWAVTPLLMLGGAYLCFEGAEKIIHHLRNNKHPSTEKAPEQVLSTLAAGPDDESLKIKGAIRTDFVLSAEIIVISLGVVADKPFPIQASTLAAIALIMTIGVYGLVACIVKLDDIGLYLSQKSGAAQSLGYGILKSAPLLMKSLSILGTAAMFLVGGGILAHGIPALHHGIAHLGHALGALGHLVEALLNGLFGLTCGALIVLVSKPFLKHKHE
jgi:predicted DNA repair protein MutK